MNKFTLQVFSERDATPAQVGRVPVWGRVTPVQYQSKEELWAAVAEILSKETGNIEIYAEERSAQGIVVACEITLLNGEVEIRNEWSKAGIADLLAIEDHLITPIVQNNLCDRVLVRWNDRDTVRVLFEAKDADISFRDALLCHITKFITDISRKTMTHPFAGERNLFSA